MKSFKEFWTTKTLIGLGLGQFLSLLITSTGFTSSELARKGIKAPTSQSFLNYVLLAVVYGIIMLHRRKPLKMKDQEYLLKNADRVELMGMLGVFGAIISAIQMSILERGELKSIHWSTGAALPFAGFSVAMFLFYSLVPVLLKINGATMLNLSLLTSDMWAVLIRIFAYKEKVDWMYYVAFAGVAVGLVIYSWGDKDDQPGSVVADEEAEQSRRLDEEAGSSRTGDTCKQ